ncbi:LysR family transcriptional regulator [Photobacterium kishitanii]|nr:LysR family transcriptional regulator [Photobacterium kishitanii]
MNIKIETLSSFIAAAEYGSFSAAARQLNKTQAAVSLTIKILKLI